MESRRYRFGSNCDWVYAKHETFKTIWKALTEAKGTWLYIYDENNELLKVIDATQNMEHEDSVDLIQFRRIINEIKEKI